MFECLLDCLPTFVVPHPGPRSIVPQDDVALADGTVLTMRPATREDTSILLEFATETEGEAVRTNYPPHELPNGPTWAAITFQYYHAPDNAFELTDAFKLNPDAELSENLQAGILDPVASSGTNLIPIGVENLDHASGEATARSFYL